MESWPEPKSPSFTGLPPGQIVTARTPLIGAVTEDAQQNPLRAATVLGERFAIGIWANRER
jgi:hypothetical protein